MRAALHVNLQQRLHRTTYNDLLRLSRSRITRITKRNVALRGVQCGQGYTIQYKIYSVLGILSLISQWSFLFFSFLSFFNTSACSFFWIDY